MAQHISSWQLADYSKVPEISCVYTITHEVSGREYIGRSVNLKDRARKHWQELISGKHKNPKLSRTFDKYGPAFVIRPIVVGSVEYCTIIEEKLLANINLQESLNCHRNSNGGWLGLKFSDESRRKLSAARMGKAISSDAMRRAVETRKESQAWKRHQEFLRSSENMAKAIAAAATPEARAKAVTTRSANGYLPFSQETRQKQQDAAKSRLFAALSWAVENNQPRTVALEKFRCSWGSLKKYQSEWEEINGKLCLPKRAIGERNGKVKFANAKKGKE